MEKDKKPKTTRPRATSKTNTTKQSTAAETVEAKKTAARKKTGPVAIDTGRTESRTTNSRKREPVNSAARKISHEEIARLAHRYWAERGHQHGHHMDDWLRAERELLGKAS